MTEGQPDGAHYASLIRSVLATCRRRKKQLKLADSTGASLNGEMTLIRALALRQVLRREILSDNERNVGVLMPPTVAGAVVSTTAVVAGAAVKGTARAVSSIGEDDEEEE